MAIMFLNVSPVSRGRGGSAVAKAAYIARERLDDARSGRTRDYRGVPGRAHAEILLPSGTPATADWARDRATLWNRAESSEHRSDARVAREYTVALPHELSREARLALAREFAQRIADRYGTAVDLAVHGPTARGDPRNHHAHILATTRELTADGLGRKATIELSTWRRRELGLPHVAQEFRTLRAEWAALANDKLREANLDVRLEPRSRATLVREREQLRASPSPPPPAVPERVASVSAPELRAAAAPGQQRTLSSDELQQRAVEQWLAYRASRSAEEAERPLREPTRAHGLDAGLEI